MWRIPMSFLKIHIDAAIGGLHTIDGFLVSLALQCKALLLFFTPSTRCVATEIEQIFDLVCVVWPFKASFTAVKVQSVFILSCLVEIYDTAKFLE